jgi:flagellar capping protein FliD
MNEIARNPEYDSLLSSIQKLETELADLVYERDMLLYHVCPKLKAEYMLKIGKLEYAVFEYQCKILRIKRKIEIIRSFTNREQSYDMGEIEKQLDREYKEYTNKLLEKQKEIDSARLKSSSYGKPLTDEEAAELKKLYTLIVKKLHPDINHDSTPEQQGHFIDAVNAYKNADLSEFRIIYLLLEKAFSKKTEDTMEKLTKKKELLLNEKKYLSEEIQKIKEGFPYIIKDMLQDGTKLQQKIDELSTLLTECQEQYNALERYLEGILKNGHE